MVGFAKATLAAPCEQGQDSGGGFEQHISARGENRQLTKTRKLQGLTYPECDSMRASGDSKAASKQMDKR